MKRRLLTLLLAAGALIAAAITALTIPAAAQTQTVYVQLATGEVVPIQVDVPDGSDLGDIQLPGAPVRGQCEERCTLERNGTGARPE